MHACMYKAFHEKGEWNKVFENINKLIIKGTKT
jgi:hypothetical protein